MTRTASSEESAWVRSALEQFERPLTHYATRMLGDGDRARDVVQDVFLKLCSQERGKVEPHLAEWLFTVCRNRALDVARKESRMTQLSDEHARARPANQPAPPEVVETREDAAHVLRLIQDLPPNQQEVIRLKFQNGFSYKEISRISGHSVSNVGFLIHIGLKTIRTRLAASTPAGHPAPAQS